MKMKTISLICLLNFSILGIYCAIDYQKVVNTAGFTVFEVHKRNRIDVANHYRETQNHHLTLSLNGAAIEEIVNQNASHWQLKLNDGSLVDFDSVTKADSNLTETKFVWHGNGAPNSKREVCFHYEANNASWFNTYQSVDQKWPMDPRHVQHTIPFNSVLEHDNFNTVGEFMYILEHLFVNTDGFAVLPDQRQPLFVRRDPNHNDAILCFSLNETYPYLGGDHSKSYFETIKLHLFGSTNIRTVTDYVVHKSGYIPRPSSIPDAHKFTYSTQYVQYHSEAEVLHFVDQLEKHGLAHSEIVLAGSWSSAHSTTQFNNMTFPTAKEMIHKIQAKGFRVGLQLFPFYTTEFNTPEEKYMLTTKEGNATGWVNFSLNQTCAWYLEQLKKLSTELGVHSFSAYAMNLLLANDSNLYLQNYLKTVSQAGNLSTQLAYKVQHLPIFVQLSDHLFANHDTILQRSFASVLALSIGGYSFVSPIPAGYFISGQHQEEVFIRMVQAYTFMPTMSFYIPTFAWDQRGQKLIDIVKKFVNLHAAHAPTIVELAERRVSDGSPIVRPIWYASPDDPKTYHINDQFMLGDDILVAPVLVVGQRERTVYLPPGTWIDQHGEAHNGAGLIKLASPLEELLYFKRKI